MFGLDRILPSRRRGADSGSARVRIEPTLPDPLAPSSGRVRLRLRFNDRFAVALTEQECQLHNIGTEGMWSDCVGADVASREMLLDVPVPQFAQPAPSPQAAEPLPIPPAVEPAAVERAPADSQTVVDAVPTPLRTMQPTLSPIEYAERLLAWCRRRGLVGEVIIFDIERAYAAMCAEERLRPRPWNPVSCEFTKLITGHVGRKTYANVEGKKRRVFRIPPSAAPSRPMDAGEAMRAAA